MIYVSFAVPTHLGDLPPGLSDAQLLAEGHLAEDPAGATEEQLLARGYVGGFRAVRMHDVPGALALAETNTRGAPGFRCHASTQREIDALTAFEAANAQTAADQLTARQVELQAACDLAKSHA